MHFPQSFFLLGIRQKYECPQNVRIVGETYCETLA
jgi:hypothetical protein